MGAYTVQVPQELGRFLAGPLRMLRYFASIFIRSMAFQSEVLLALFNENCLPDDMLQCGTESKSVIVIMGPQVRVLRWMGAARGSSSFKHIAQQTSLDVIPVDITPTRVDALVSCDADA
jgi:hypothetical protein